MSESQSEASPAGRANSRELILRTAAACFAKDSYSHTRMVAIARAAGISRAGLYKHFASKGDLLVALNDFLIADWRAWTEESVAGAASAQEAIGFWLREGLADAWRVTAVQVVTSEDAQRDLVTDHGATRDALLATREILTQVLQRGIESGELREDLDPGATARSLQAVLLGLLRNQLAERPVVSLEGREDVEALVDLVVHGLVERGIRRRGARRR